MVREVMPVGAGPTGPAFLSWINASVGALPSLHVYLAAQHLLVDADGKTHEGNKWAGERGSEARGGARARGLGGGEEEGAKVVGGRGELDNWEKAAPLSLADRHTPPLASDRQPPPLASNGLRLPALTVVLRHAMPVSGTDIGSAGTRAGSGGRVHRGVHCHVQVPHRSSPRPTGAGLPPLPQALALFTSAFDTVSTTEAKLARAVLDLALGFRGESSRTRPRSRRWLWRLRTRWSARCQARSASAETAGAYIASMPCLPNLLAACPAWTRCRANLLGACSGLTRSLANLTEHAPRGPPGRAAQEPRGLAPAFDERHAGRWVRAGGWPRRAHGPGKSDHVEAQRDTARES